MEKTTKAKCEKCIYSWTASGMVVCHYIVDTKQRRGCPVGYCDKFEPRKRKRKKKTEV